MKLAPFLSKEDSQLHAIQNLDSNQAQFLHYDKEAYLLFQVLK